MKKVKVDAKHVFYLLGECGNESFGIQIEGVQVQDLPGDFDITGDVLHGVQDDGVDLTAGDMVLNDQYLGGLIEDDVSYQHQFDIQMPQDDPTLDPDQTDDTDNTDPDVIVDQTDDNNPIVTPPGGDPDPGGDGGDNNEDV